MLSENGACPFPDSSHLSLAGEPVTSGCDGDGVPVLESNVGTVEVDKELVMRRRASADRTRTSGWRRLFDTVVGKVAAPVSNVVFRQRLFVGVAIYPLTAGTVFPSFLSASSFLRASTWA